MFKKTEYIFVSDMNDKTLVFKVIITRANVLGIDYWDYKTSYSVLSPMGENMTVNSRA